MYMMMQEDNTCTKIFISLSGFCSVTIFQHSLNRFRKKYYTENNLPSHLRKKGKKKIHTKGIGKCNAKNTRFKNCKYRKTSNKRRGF